MYNNQNACIISYKIYLPAFAGHTCVSEKRLIFLGCNERCLPLIRLGTECIKLTFANSKVEMLHIQ